MSQSMNIRKDAKRVFKKIRMLQQAILHLPFRTRLYELTNRHIFHFDIYKIINEQTYSQVDKFCKCFFLFLVIKVTTRFCKPCSDIGAKKKSSFKQKMNNKNLSGGDCLKIEKFVQKQSKNSRVCTTIDFAIKAPKKDEHDSLAQKGFNRAMCKLDGMGGEEQQKVDEIGYLLQKASKDLRQSYFLLNECFNNKHRVKKIEIICFLIALISGSILIPLIEQLEKQFLNFNGNPTAESPWTIDTTAGYQSVSCFQEEVYIVLTYQTLGNLVSDNVFKYLKKKYIKQTIFKTDTDQGYTTLIKSLKHIKDRLAHNNGIAIKGRKQRAQELEELRKKKSIVLEEGNSLSLEKMKIFLNQSLRTHQFSELHSLSTIKNKINDPLDQPRFKMQQRFYPSNFRAQFTPIAFFSKENPIRKFSISIKAHIHTPQFRLKTNERPIKLKCLTKEQKIFCKRQDTTGKIGNLAKIRSERNSHKFTKLTLENNSQATNCKMPVKQDPAGQMRLKLSQFRKQAMRDLATIEMFKPFLSKQIGNQICLESKARHKNANSKYGDQTSILAQEKQVIGGRQQRKTIQIRSINQVAMEDESVWHPLYNIRRDFTPSNLKKEASVVHQFQDWKKWDRLGRKKSALGVRA